MLIVLQLQITQKTQSIYSRDVQSMSLFTLYVFKVSRHDIKNGKQLTKHAIKNPFYVLGVVIYDNMYRIQNNSGSSSCNSHDNKYKTNGNVKFIFIRMNF